MASITFGQLLSQESQRLRRKGWWLVLGCLLLAWLLIGHLEIIRLVYPQLPIEGHPFVLAGIYLALQYGSFLGNLLVWEFLYAARLPFFDQYRVDPGSWPWEKTPENHAALRQKVLRAHYLIFLVIAPAIAFVAALGPVRVDLSVNGFPTIAEHCTNLLVFMLFDDVSFYWTHRLMHVPHFYKRFHKIHHEFTETSYIATQYLHPVEYILTGPLPVFGVILLRGKSLHVATIWVWIIVRYIVAIDGHSGFDFPWSPFRVMPFTGGASYHDRHHRNNKGNLTSFFVLWDFFCGTYDGFTSLHLKAS